MGIYGKTQFLYREEEKCIQVKKTNGCDGEVLTDN